MPESNLVDTADGVNWQTIATSSPNAFEVSSLTSSSPLLGGDVAGVLALYARKRAEVRGRPSDNFLERMLHALTLQAGWNGARSQPVSPDTAVRAVLQAIRILPQADQATIDVAPTHGGGLWLEWKHHEEDEDILIDPSPPFDVEGNDTFIEISA
jgi:hypothetical protein